LCHDPLLAVLAGKREIEEPLAGKSMLDRMELTPTGSPLTERYHKITYSTEALDELLVGICLEAHPRPPRQIVLDLDATDTPLHGQQEARFFHGYYHHSCYLPLYIFCGDHVLCARLSMETLRANQLRLYVSSLADVLVHALRRLGLRGTAWASAQVETIQWKLLKIAAQVRITARRIWIGYSGAYPWKPLFAAAWSALRC